MSTPTRNANPFAGDVAEAEALGVSAAYLASRELGYLAAVGALEHLRYAGARLGVPIPPTEAGLIPKPTRAKAASGALPEVYGRAERLALDCLTRLTPGQARTVARRLRADVDLCLDRRRALLGKELPIPGLTCWLTSSARPSENRANGLATVSHPDAHGAAARRSARLVRVEAQEGRMAA
jgi:hypothetical protein